ncbi:MAG: hypothetical protein A3B96_01345 [Candidatus Spechtbacteria bacterium RIFCSPHIGHO2_02_FULL_43_15b]|nr:MAG: hypothetical protein A3B96_01345 [Candidatus Spechtbacteria bacterium RIFCSPHIGHO2_02_FULL_43_15b]
MRKLLITIIFSTFVATACVGPADPIQIEPQIEPRGNITVLESVKLEPLEPYSTITVFHDDFRRVTCWYYYYGLSCVSDYQLPIDKN